MSGSRWSVRNALVLGLGCGVAPIAQGYEGFGALTGGAASCPTGATTYHVTSLADSGAGTLRDAVSQGCRHVVFDVGGTITLASHLRVRTSYLTIDGASAPAPGITISQPTVNTGVMIESSSSSSAHDIIVHNLRHVGPGGHDDSIADMWGLDGEANPVYNVVLDHISVSGSNDGTFDLYGDVRDVTISWNLVTDTLTALHLSHDTSLRERISFHHNVFARNNERQIRMRHQNGVIDYVNNVVYGWGWEECAARGLDFPSGSINDNEWPKINVEGNLYHYVAGLPCGDPDDAVTRQVNGRIYFNGNSFPPGENDTASTSPRHAIPAYAEVTRYPAPTLGNNVVPCVGTHFRTAAEQALLLQVAVAVGGSGAGCLSAVVPVVSLADAGATEGNVGTTPATFVASLSVAPAAPVTVQFATSGGTATAGVDFQSASGTLTFNPGTVSLPLPVAVVGDTLIEQDETFGVNLSNAVGATLGDVQADGLISDDDAASLSALELAHGSRVAASFGDLNGASGMRAYRIAQAPRSSYEVMVDGISGDTTPLTLERLAADNATVLQSGVAVGVGGAISLRWQNASSTPVTNQAVRLRSGDCTTNCGAEDVYRIRLYDTTYYASRFNNTDGQFSVLLVQNTTTASVTGRAYFWSVAGVLIDTQTLTLGPRQTATLLTQNITSLAGKQGTITITHTASYGGLAGKVVALQPATGYSFDTPLLQRVR